MTIRVVNVIRQGKAMKIFESLILCCSTCITAVGFPPCKLCKVYIPLAASQALSLIASVIEQAPTKTAPGKMQKQRKSI